MPDELKSSVRVTRYCKDWKQLARALGLDISPHSQKATARQLNKSQPLVAEFIASSFCPKKNPPKKGWRVDEITPAFNKFLTQRREETKAPGKKNPQISPSAADLQKLNDGDGDLPFLKMSPAELAAQKTRRLDYLQDIYLHPGQRLAPSGGSFLRLTAREEDDLRADRPWLFGDSSTNPEETGIESITAAGAAMGSGTLPPAESQKMLALYLAKHFAGRITIDISEQQISNWKKQVWASELPGNTPPPPPKLNNRYDTKAWAEWVEKFILPFYLPPTGGRQGEMVRNLMQMASDANYQREIDEARIKRIELLAAEGRYIEADIAQRAVSGMATMLFNEMRARIEKVLPGLGTGQFKTLLKLSEEQAQQLSAALRDEGAALVDGLHRWCGEKSKELENNLTAETQSARS